VPWLEGILEGLRLAGLLNESSKDRHSGWLIRLARFEGTSGRGGRHEVVRWLSCELPRKPERALSFGHGHAVAVSIDGIRSWDRDPLVGEGGAPDPTAQSKPHGSIRPETCARDEIRVCTRR
jgi:hypothetical protein